MLNCVGDRAVLNFKGKSSGRWMQYSCVIDEKMKSILERMRREDQGLLNGAKVIFPAKELKFP